jgi:hypothetical protein
MRPTLRPALRKLLLSLVIATALPLGQLGCADPGAAAGHLMVPRVSCPNGTNWDAVAHICR